MKASKIKSSARKSKSRLSAPPPAKAGAGRAKKASKRAAGSATRKATKPMAARRADYGAAVDGFFAKQAPALRPILDALRALIAEVVPEASSMLKWGMPFYEIAGKPVCALGGHKAHVNLILAGPPGTFADPRGLLSGEGKTGRHLKLSKLEELPRAEVRAWLKSARAAAKT